MTENKNWSINLDKWTTDAGFSFETQAKEDFGIGFMYDISRGFSNGSFLLKMIKNLNNALDLDTKLEFNNFNGDFGNDFNGTYYLHWKNHLIAEVKMQHKVELGIRHTLLNIKARNLFKLSKNS